MASAKFQLSADGGLSWLAADVPLASGLGLAQVGGNASVYARPASAAGIDTISWSIIAASENAPLLTLTTYPDKSVRTLVPLDSAAAYLLRCVVNGGIDPLTKRPSPDLVSALAIKVLTTGGQELLAPGEGDEGDRAFGWTTAFNALALAGIGAGTATRIRANSSAYLAGDVTLADGANFAFTQVGSTITGAATGGGSALPSPYTATLATVEGRANSLQVTAPTVSAIDAPNILIKGVGAHELTPDDVFGGDVIIEGGDTDSTDAGSPGRVVLRGGLGAGTGQGGVIAIQGGDAVNSGGGVEISSGDASAPGGASGSVSILSGSCLGQAGIVSIGGGNGETYGGDMYVRAGDASAGQGGFVICKAGKGSTPGQLNFDGSDGVTNGAGGLSYFRGGVGNGTGAGGACTIAGGAGGATGSGGGVLVAGGASTGGSGQDAGGVSVLGGNATGTAGEGGTVTIEAGDATGNPGALFCSAGNGTAGNAGGGNAFLSGGNSVGSGAAGYSRLLGGAAAGSGAGGECAMVAGNSVSGAAGDVLLTPGTGASSSVGRTRVTRGAFTVEGGSLVVQESTAVVKQISETCPPLTTTSTAATLAWSYALATSENLWITVQATGDPGTAATAGAVAYTAQFRRTTADNSGAAQQCGTTQDMSPNGGVAKNSFSVTIALNGNTVEVKVVAPNATSTLWAVAVGGIARTGPV